jgi:hypothetical protein
MCTGPISSNLGRWIIGQENLEQANTAVFLDVGTKENDKIREINSEIAILHLLRRRALRQCDEGRGYSQDIPTGVMMWLSPICSGRISDFAGGPMAFPVVLSRFVNPSAALERILKFKLNTSTNFAMDYVVYREDLR